MKKTLISVSSLLACFPLLAATPALTLNLEQVSVSGLSSGGYMATQFHVAYSNWVKGIGVIAAGPYYCAQGSIATALNQCVNKLEGDIPFDDIQRQLEDYEQKGLIAATKHLTDSKVWLLHGKLDTRVIEPVMDGLYKQYSSWVRPENIKYSKNENFAHHFPTRNQGSKCSVSEAPFLGNCDFDAAGEMLSFIIDTVSAPSDKKQGKLVPFNQQKMGGDAASSLANTGYYYLPESCVATECNIHINFHGCNQNAEKVGTDYVENNGLNRWADTNNMVILYPQTKSSMMLPLNPQACWDWWGYTDDKYATNRGQQIHAVRTMLLSLSNQPTDKELP